MEKPYLIKRIVIKKKVFNPKFGDEKECKCGHTYYRHFDTFDDMAAIGCKYCQCYKFKIGKGNQMGD